MVKPKFRLDKKCPECGDFYTRKLEYHHKRACSKKITAMRDSALQYSKRLDGIPKEVYADKEHKFTSNGSKGAFGELIVSADLLKQGFHVFRSVSPNCPCDLVAMDELGRVSRVEVKSSKPSAPQIGYCNSDIVAVVSNNEIKYFSTKSFYDDQEVNEILISSLR